MKNKSWLSLIGVGLQVTALLGLTAALAVVAAMIVNQMLYPPDAQAQVPSVSKFMNRLESAPATIEGRTYLHKTYGTMNYCVNGTWYRMAPPYASTGAPGAGTVSYGPFYIDTAGNTAYIYADAAWRSIATW